MTKAVILNGIGGDRVARITFKKAAEEQIVQKLKEAGFEIDIRRNNS